jgi:hypothetical protein
MNVPISQRAYDCLPFREDLKGDPVCNGMYKAKGEPNTILIARCANGSSAGKFTAWEAYTAEITYADIPHAPLP